MFKIFNPFIGEHEDFEDIELAKVRVNTLILECLIVFKKEPIAGVISTNQPYNSELAVAEQTYFSFFNKVVKGCYHYTVFDIVNGVRKARCFYFIDELGLETLIKVDGTTTLELYHRPLNEKRSVTYDLQTKLPIFYYSHQDLQKYDYYTDTLLAVNEISSTTLSADMQLLLANFPEITNVGVHGQKEYGYAVEYIENPLMEPNNNYDEEYDNAYKESAKLVPIIREVVTPEGTITEIIDTSLWTI
jgi:hypothetical protein